MINALITTNLFILYYSYCIEIAIMRIDLITANLKISIIYIYLFFI